MDIEEFYAADERRRQSSEIEIGTEWRDSQGVPCELNWVQDTGELYVMREPVPGVYVDPIIFGDVRVSREPVKVIGVVILGTIATHDELEQVLSGWQEAMDAENSVSWITDRLAAAGIAAAPAADA
jgi:hypothetical protein